MKIILRNISRIWVETALLAALLASCCHINDKSKADAPASPNKQLLDEVNRFGSWLHAKKTWPIWARKVVQEQMVNTLEGPVLARAGDFLCRGEANEVWPQKATDLETRYTPAEVVDDEGWRKYYPRPDAEGVMAAQVKHTFQVDAKWGRLSGKAGDYVVKNFRDRGVAYPKDVWIVDQRLFVATYEVVSRPPAQFDAGRAKIKQD